MQKASTAGVELSTLVSIPVGDELTPDLEKQLAERLTKTPGVNVGQHLQAALKRHNQSWSTIVSEIWKLMRGPGKLTVQEYFYYRLYDSALSFADKQTFVGKKAQYLMHTACNNFDWFAVFHDKLVFQATMTGLGLPTPRLLAIYHPFRQVSDVRKLCSASDLARFLRNGMTYPFFAKPIDGMFSLGARSVESYDPEGDRLVLADGEQVPVDRFARYVEDRGQSGYVFQERLVPHDSLATLVGDRVSTVRMIVLMKDDGPELFRALCKIPAGNNVADNFWRTGNMLGAVELESGRLLRVVAGAGEDQVLVESHPDTGRALPGAVLPCWQEAKALCLTAASALPGARTQAWDIALCRDGPVLVEANFGGDLNLPQIAFGAGMLDDRFRQHLRDCGYKLS